MQFEHHVIQKAAEIPLALKALESYLTAEDVRIGVAIGSYASQASRVAPISWMELTIGSSTATAEEMAERMRARGKHSFTGTVTTARNVVHISIDFAQVMASLGPDVAPQKARDVSPDFAQLCDLLEARSSVKLVHDVRIAADALWHQLRVRIAPCVDIALLALIAGCHDTTPIPLKNMPVDLDSVMVRVPTLAKLTHRFQVIAAGPSHAILCLYDGLCIRCHSHSHGAISTCKQVTVTQAEDAVNHKFAPIANGIVSERSLSKIPMNIRISIQKAAIAAATSAQPLADQFNATCLNDNGTPCTLLGANAHGKKAGASEEEKPNPASVKYLPYGVFASEPAAMFFPYGVPQQKHTGEEAVNTTVGKIVTANDEDDDDELPPLPTGRFQLDAKSMQSHPVAFAAPGVAPPCRYHFTGTCARGEKCSYSHEAQPLFVPIPVVIDRETLVKSLKRRLSENVHYPKTAFAMPCPRETLRGTCHKHCPFLHMPQRIPVTTAPLQGFSPETLCEDSFMQGPFSDMVKWVHGEKYLRMLGQKARAATRRAASTCGDKKRSASSKKQRGSSSKAKTQRRSNSAPLVKKHQQRRVDGNNKATTSSANKAAAPAAADVNTTIPHTVGRALTRKVGEQPIGARVAKKPQQKKMKKAPSACEIADQHNLAPMHVPAVGNTMAQKRLIVS